MSLNIIYGVAGSGKSTVCMKKIKSIVSAGGTAVLIVPEQFSHQAELNMIREGIVPGLSGADVFSFKRMARNIIKITGGLPHTVINEVGKSILLGRAISEVKSELFVYAKSAMQQGFIEKMEGIINEFKRYEVSSEKLMSVVNNISENESKKLLDIANIYSNYEKIYSDKYIDANDELTILSDRLAENNIYSGYSIFIDGFTDFTGQEMRIINMLLLQVDEVNITLSINSLNKYYYDDIFEDAYDSYCDLIDMANDSNVVISEPCFAGDINHRVIDKGELCFLEKAYRAYDAGTFNTNCENIKIMAADNPFIEIEQVAISIRKLLRDGGYRQKDIMVVSRNLDFYEKAIHIIFEKYDIAYFIDSKMNVAKHPIVMLLTVALDLAMGKWTYNNIMRYLRTGLTDIAREDIDILENYILAYGKTTRKVWRNDCIWNEYNDLKNDILKPIDNLAMNINNSDDIKSQCSSIIDFLDNIKLPETILKATEYLGNMGEITLAKQYSSVYNLIVSILEQITKAYDSEKLSITQISEALNAGVTGADIGTVPTGLDQVNIGRAEHSRSQDIVIMYVIGANDGVFPMIMSDDGILLDADRVVLRNNDINIAPDTKAKTFAEEYLVYKTLTTPSQKLFVSYSIANYESQAMRPSHIISRLKEIFPKIEIEDTFQNADDNIIDNIVASIPTIDNFINAIGESRNGEISRQWGAVNKWYNENSKFNNIIDEINYSLKYNDISTKLNNESIESLGSNTLFTTVSRLEQYARCPFSYFVQYTLRAKERKKFQIDARDTGDFLHKGIELFSDKVRAAGINWHNIKDDWKEVAITEVIEILINEHMDGVLNSSHKYKYIFKKLTDMLRNTIDMIIFQVAGGSFEPIGFEMRFANGGDIEAIKLDLNGGKNVIITGIIDRVDELKVGDENYYRVIDYKTGKRKLSIADIYDGLSLQLITYMEAVIRSKNGKMGGMLYFLIDEPIVDGTKYKTDEEIENAIKSQMKLKGYVLADNTVIDGMDATGLTASNIIEVSRKKDGSLTKYSRVMEEADFALIRDRAFKQLKEAAKSFMNGNISIKPYKKGQMTGCDFCKYGDICNFSVGAENCSYNVMNNMKEEEVWNILREEGKVNE